MSTMANAPRGMAGRSKTPPKGEVRPLGTSKPKLVTKPRFAVSKSTPKRKPNAEEIPQPAVFGPVTSRLVDSGYFEASEKVSSAPQKTLDSQSGTEVESSHPPIPVETSVELPMNLTLKGKSQNGKRAIYTAGPTTVHFPLSAFPGEPPTSIQIEDVFAAPKEAKPKETKEERKARLAAQPKPTLAQRAEAARKRAAKLEEQALAAANAGSL